METALLFLTVISGGAGVLVSILPSVTEVWKRGEDGKGRPTRGGGMWFAVAGLSWLCLVGTYWIQKTDADREESVADAKSQARTDSITRRLERLSSRAEAIAAESEHLREIQLSGLQQIDSVAASSRELAEQQQRALDNLGSSLTLSHFIADSLQASVALSRQIVDSLRLAESRAVERARQTLGSVESSRNPLSFIRARIHMGIPRNTPAQAAVVDRLYAARQSDQRLANVRTSGRWAIVDDGKREPILLPAMITLDFWRGDDKCERSGQHLLRATRGLDYTTPQVIFHDGVFLHWEEAEFEFQTRINLSVDDLKDACVGVSFYGEPMYSETDIVEFWGSATAAVSEFVFPQGRTASVKYRAAHSTTPGFESTNWIGRLNLDPDR